MAMRVPLIIVLLLAFLTGFILAESGSCDQDVVNITAKLKPDWKSYIQSPGFPNNYPANATCTWRVTLSDLLPRIYGIALKVDTWQIESCTRCSCDYVVYGNEWSIKNSIDPVCHTFSENYFSLLETLNVRSLFFISRDDRELWIRFHSDHSSQFKGFKGQLIVYNQKSGCDNYINDTSGSISSPKYPSHYPKGQVITWCLAVPHGFRVKLKFSAFELEDTKNKEKDCVNDFVEIRDGGRQIAGRNGRFGDLLGRFCGNTIPTEEIYSKSNQMWVQFVSDNNATTVYKGFRAEFVNGGILMTSTIAMWLLATTVWLVL